MRVKKAVIPAAGWGTRFLPVTKSMPKEMLPIIDKPIIQFAVLLGDDIIKDDTPCIKQLVDVYQKYKNSSSVIAVEEVKNENVSRYGIIRGTEIDKLVYRIEDIIEKPSLDEAPSNIGAVGRYILTPEIFDCIKETPQGKGNEIQLTDAIRNLSFEKKALPKK
ncbi:UTP--glucose-1-phosphate uridylyltransferase AglF [ANME-1 cluster archaeon GoMg3.2]|nr:UTP--glucose-1-phosphate uridylyltransferase AglF [ANME-1 cluster archaeon GoMg3.2]